MYLNKQIGNVPVNELKRSHVLKALRSIQAKGLSRSSIENARNVISGICEFAIDHEYLSYNPCAGILKRMGLQKKNHNKPVVIFTEREMSLILSTCDKLYPEWYPFYLTASRTGLRLGELLALKWEKVNWQSKYIVIDSSFRNGQLTEVKNEKPRNVDMSDQLIATLKALNIKRKEEALKAGSNEVEPIIFHTKGGYTSQNSVRNVWKRILEKAKLDHRKFHTIRHTFASLLISKGKSLAYIKDMLGHYSIQMTVDVYGHLVPSENREAVNSLDDDATNRNLSATTKKKAPTTI